MNWKNAIMSLVIVGIIGAVIMFASTPVFEILSPGLAKEYEQPAFRPWSDPVMSLFFAYPFAVGLFAALFYEQVRSSFPGNRPFKKGIHYGFMLWLVTGIPAFIVNYSSFTFSLPMILSWTISGLITLLLGGMAIAWIYERH